MKTLHKNMRQRDALIAARELGYYVAITQQAEWCCWHPLRRRRWRMSTKRHDVVQGFLSEMRQIAREQGIL